MLLSITLLASVIALSSCWFPPLALPSVVGTSRTVDKGRREGLMSSCGYLMEQGQVRYWASRESWCSGPQHMGRLPQVTYLVIILIYIPATVGPPVQEGGKSEGDE